MSAASYYDVNSGNTATATNRYNEVLQYDLRGNITSLQRQGYYSSTCSYGQIDNLVYTYDTANPNRLKSVADSAPLSQRSHGFNPGSGGVGYTYDANGNLKTDSYKGLTNIVYNHLNLPTRFEWGTLQSLEISYDASGRKLTQTTKTGTTITMVVDYVDGVEYRRIGTGSKRIEAIYHAEGRYANQNAESSDVVAWRREYTLKDHLGNARLSFTDKDPKNGVVDVTNNSATSDILQVEAQRKSRTAASGRPTTTPSACPSRGRGCRTTGRGIMRIGIMGRNWSGTWGWGGMIMGRGGTMRRSGGGVRWIRWQARCLPGHLIHSDLIIR